MKKSIYIFVLLLIMTVTVSAQVVRTPQIFYTPAFSAEPDIMTDSASWMSFRHMLNQQQAPDFGHDWKSGLNISIFSSSFITVAGLAETTFHFTAAPEPLSEWIFNAGSLISDLRLLFYLDLNPVLLESGFHHDCKHEVDRRSVRLQIHDTLFIALRPKSDIELIKTDVLGISTNFAVEGGYNLPAVFQDAPPQPDLGHIAGFFRIKGEFVTEPRLAVLSDGSVSATWRSADSSVTGLEHVGIDYSLRGGVGAAGKYGMAAFYIGTERLTDSWADFEEQPVNIQFITLELTAFKQSSK